MEHQILLLTSSWILLPPDNAGHSRKITLSLGDQMLLKVTLLFHLKFWGPLPKGLQKPMAVCLYLSKNGTFLRNTGNVPGDHKPTSSLCPGSERLIDLSKITQGTTNLNQELGLLNGTPRALSAPGEAGVTHEVRQSPPWVQLCFIH